ncbi:Rieske [2Fe-2S] iron-sulfur domain-containing protein [Globomyces pollinis-pini]|nr:Rieske [2Fe-2S] iron-sulfur domain-containing protein [Globomyces pollinis-pini]
MTEQSKFQLKADLNLKEYWYPISLVEHIKDKPIGLHILGEPIVLFKSNNGIVCLADKCAHRSAPLSVGQVLNGNLECLYHGWQYDSDGNVVEIPAKLPEKGIPSSAKSKKFPLVIKDGLVWIYPGKKSNEAKVPDLHPGNHAPGFGKPFARVTDLDIDHSLMVENLLDPAHLPFTHNGTLSNRSKVSPMTLDLQFGEGNLFMFGDNVITKSPNQKTRFYFYPPCHVLLEAEIIPGWKMVQSMHCVPIRPGHMRLVFLQGRNFFNWYVPGLEAYLTSFSDKIVFQDYEMLHGQQLRLQQKANPWNSTIAVDIMPKTYRNWFKKTRGWFAGYGDIEDMNTDGCTGCGDTDSYDEYRYTRQEGVNYTCYELNKPKDYSLVSSKQLILAVSIGIIGVFVGLKYLKA